MSNSKRPHAPKEEKRGAQEIQLSHLDNRFQQWKSIVKLDHRDQCGSCVNHDTSADATALVIHE